MSELIHHLLHLPTVTDSEPKQKLSYDNLVHFIKTLRKIDDRSTKNYNSHHRKIIEMLNTKIVKGNYIPKVSKLRFSLPTVPPTVKMASNLVTYDVIKSTRLASTS